MTPDEACALVQDLQPLYREGLISQATAAFIVQHIAGCPNCRAIVEAADAAQTAAAEILAAAPAAPVTPEGFLRHWRQRLRLLGAAALIVMLVAAALGARVGLSSQPSAASRYRAFALTVPGYAAAAATGAILPLHRALRIGGETVTLDAFYATYQGSYLIFTADTARLVPILPYLSADGMAAPQNQGVPTASTPIASDAIAGYWFLPGLQVPWVLSTDHARTAPAHVTLRVSLGTGGSAQRMVLSIPRGAYRPHGLVALRRTATFHAGGSLVRLDSLEMSSAGTVVQGAFQGAGAAPQLHLRGCPAFVAPQGCGTGATWVLPLQGGWRRFVMVLGSPTPAVLRARVAELQLGDLLVEHIRPISRVLAWPPHGLPGPGTDGGGLALGRTDQGAVSLTAASPYEIWIATASRGKGKDAPPVDLRAVDLTLPGGTRVQGQVQAVAEIGPIRQPKGQNLFEYTFTASFLKPVPAPLWHRTGTARISLTLGTYTAHTFPRGAVWRP